MDEFCEFEEICDFIPRLVRKKRVTYYGFMLDALFLKPGLLFEGQTEIYRT
jgi:hypothetical protein